MLTKSPADWYRSAERAYVQHHQGCPWCGGAHRVHVVKAGSKHAYRCQHCDFQATFDSHRNQYHVVPGEDVSVGAETMLDLPIVNLT